MSHREHRAKTPSRRTGFFAVLRAFLHLPGTGAPSSRHLALASILTAAALALTAAPASAAPPNFCPPGSSAGHCDAPQAVAVDQSSGDVYVADYNNSRIDEFDSAGHFLRAFGFGVLNGENVLQTCTTTCIQGKGGLRPKALAVDNSSHPSAGDIYVFSESKVEKYKFNSSSEEFELLLSFGSQGTGPGQFRGEVNPPIAIDAAGHVWVGDNNRLEEFSEAGALLSEISLPGAGEILALAIDTDSSSPNFGDFYAAPRPIDELQRITPPLSGSYELCFKSVCTPPLPFDAAGSEVIEALEALSTIGPVNVVGGTNGGTVDVEFVGALASTNVPQLLASAGSVATAIEGNPGELLKLESDGTFVEALDQGGHPDALALDPATGDLFVGGCPRGGTIFNPCTGPYTLLTFNPAGAQTEAFGSGEVIGAPKGNALAFGDTAQALYVVGGSAVQAFPLPEPGPLPIAGSAKANPIAKLAATLCARLNPEGASTTAHFQYIAATQFAQNEAEGHDPFTGALETTESASLGSGFEAVELCQPLSSLEPATEYRFRLVAHNANAEPAGVFGETASFTTLPPAAIDSTSASEVTGDSATLEAQINPLGDATSYHFEYLTQAKYEENLAAEQPPFSGAAQAPLQPAAIGSGSTDVSVSQHLQGLLPHTAYRFRAVVTNAVSESHGGPFAGPVHAFTTQPAASLALPDRRAWEQVSPPAKHGADLLPIREAGLIQASASGDAVAYLATAPTEAEAPANPFIGQVLSARAPGGWASHDVALPHSGISLFTSGEGKDNVFYSADLSQAIAQPSGAFTPSTSPAASEQTPYLRANFAPGDPSAFCTASCYRPIVTGCPSLTAQEEGDECPPAVAAAADVPPGTKFGAVSIAAGRPCPPAILCGPGFTDATPDLSHVVLESGVGLTSAPGDKGGSYEWLPAAPPAESLHKLDLSPAGQPFKGVSAAGGRNAISTDGSRVVLEDASTKHLYLRVNATAEQSNVEGTAVDGSQCTELSEGKACTIQLDALQGGPGAAQTPHALFQLASADGSRVFFVDSQQLTADSGTAPGSGDGDLYEYDLQRPAGQRLADLTPASGGESAEVQGSVIGAAEDGSYLYFVANGALAPNASPGDCHETGNGEFSGPCNLYLRHEGTTSFIAALSGEDFPDWAKELKRLTARVSPNGRWLAFMSQLPLSGYDNRDAVSGQPDQEVFLYHAAAEAGEEGKLLCASCNPSGARPHGVEYSRPGGLGNLRLAGGDRVWPSSAWLAANVPGWTPYGNDGRVLHQSRYLSNGGRLFFNSSDALVPADSNRQEDVYTYEPPQGSEEAPPNDTCTTASPTYSPASEGCVDLITSGASATESAFLGASENGDDVFFLTSSQLTSSDTDTALDVYDARAPHTPGEAVGFPEAVKPVECAGDACQQPAVPPNDATPGSLTFQGAGNVVECPNGKTLKGGKCVAKKAKKGNKKKNSNKKKQSKKAKGKGAKSKRGTK